MVYGVTAGVGAWAPADVRPLRGFQAFEVIAVLGPPAVGSDEQNDGYGKT